MLTVESLLWQLVKTSSLSGQEKPLARFLSSLLAKKGFSVVHIPVSSNRFSVLAALGKPKVILNAHLDTVPPILPSKRTASWIYGRGACDTKGSMAAMITAAVKAKHAGLSNFGLAFTTAEETTLDGAYALKKAFRKIPYMVVGEPTCLKPINAHYGLFDFSVITSGKACHSSQPHLGTNAINKLLPIIDQIKTMPLHQDSLLNLVRISGGSANNIIPPQAEAVFDMRLSPNDSTDYLSNLISIAGQSCQVSVIEDTPSVSCPLPPSLKFLGSPASVRYMTELSVYRHGLVLGPGDIKCAHSDNEKISLRQLHQAVDLYGRILRAYL